MDKITENIWLGDDKSAKNITILKKEGINKILSVMDNQFPKYDKKDNFIHKKIGVIDTPSENIIKYFGESINFMESEEKVLVHCKAGASRSASFVIAYIMWKQNKTFEEALDYVNKKRCINPNIGFIEQLKMFEKLLKDNKNDLNVINFKNIK